MPILNRLQEVMEAKDVSRQELCRRVGCSRGTLANILNFKFQPSFTLAFQIAEALGVSLCDIFFYEKEK